MTKKDKLKIEVFLPFGSCVCDFAPFMEKVANVTSKFEDFVNVEMKSIKSPEASKYGVQDLSVIVDGDVKLSADFDEKELEKVIRGKIR
jgi:hypothetical protein